MLLARSASTLLTTNWRPSWCRRPMRRWPARYSFMSSSSSVRGVRAQHGGAVLHHALRRRDRDNVRSAAGCADRQPAAGAVSGLQGLSRPVLWGGTYSAADLCAEGARCPRRLGGAAGEGMTLLSLNGITRRFGGLIAVDGVDLAVAKGGVTAVIGPNGAGKTTLFNIISGFQAPNAGRIVFDGIDITAHPPEAIAAAGVVRTFQLVQLFQNLSVLENVKVGSHLHT